MQLFNIAIVSGKRRLFRVPLLLPSPLQLVTHLNQRAEGVQATLGICSPQIFFLSLKSASAIQGKTQLLHLAKGQGETLPRERAVAFLYLLPFFFVVVASLEAGTKRVLSDGPRKADPGCRSCTTMGRDLPGASLSCERAGLLSKGACLLAAMC